MNNSFPDFNLARILVVGDVMLDSYWHGNTTRISPESPVPVVHINSIEERAGGASNVALNITAIGGNAKLLGVIGDDLKANCLEKILSDANVESLLVRDASLPTTNKLRVISRSQQLIRLDFEEQFICDSACLQDLSALYEQELDNVDLVILSDYAKGTLGEVQKLIQLACSKNKPVIVDPKSRDFSIYAGATLIKPNMDEFEVVVGKCSSEDDLVAKARLLIEQFSFMGILVTRGAHGMSLVYKDAEPLHFPAKVSEVYDVSGAGDTVAAILGVALAAGSNLEQAVSLANAAASVVVKKFGIATVSQAELRRAMQRQQHTPQAGILTEEQLLEEVLDARKRGEKIVFTNGCFDILHAGHVDYLEKAKALGQRLIVAVNDDASVARLKGPTRPINTLEQRMFLLSALRAVDWVVPFSEDTPTRLIETIAPDVLVKGNDYEVHQIAGSDFVLQNGGEIITVPLLEGFSTTGLLKKIAD